MADSSVTALESFVDKIATVASLDARTARSQVFAPTGYPDKISVAPGVVMVKPDRFDYAPDIDVADRKIAAYTAKAKAGKIAVINISIEPGSGKTLYLPFKFPNSKILVVLPTVFDAWSAHTAGTSQSNINVYGFSSAWNSNVTYTDSYHAAFLLTTGRMSAYNMVFIDESHSQEGVTSFMASVAIPGLVFVRMTASPPTANSRPKRSFPIMEERDVPPVSDLSSVADYVSARSESRVLVMAPSPKCADDISALVPRSRTLTMLSPLTQLDTFMAHQSEGALIVSDAVCGKGVNLNVDCVVDFGSIDTPGGRRTITKPEQLQRKARVGRSKPGVYCCSVSASASKVVDDYSIFRSNLWLIVNGLDPFPCQFPAVVVSRAHQLLASMSEPALVPIPSEPIPESVPVTPVIDDATDSGDSVDDTTPLDHTDGNIYCNVLVDDDEDVASVVGDRDFATPSWYAYYVESHNHPIRYVADLIYDHRGIQASAVMVDKQLTIKPAPNSRPIVSPVSPQKQMAYGMGRSRRVGIHSSASTSGVWTEPKQPEDSVTSGTQSTGKWISTDSDRSGVKFGTMSYSVKAYEPVHLPGRNIRPKVGPIRARTTDFSNSLYDGEHLGGPLAILRGTKLSAKARGTSYKVASVCGGYLAVSGVVLATAGDMHSGLVPMHQDSRRALHETTASSSVVNATHYLCWVTTVPLDTVDVQAELSSIKAAGAWSVPPNNIVPTIDLSLEYHASWVSVITDRIRNHLPLPPVVPRGGWYTKSRTRRIPSDDVLSDAIDLCDSPSYSHDEQQRVYRAWNVLAVRSSVLGAYSSHVYADAFRLLSYMAAADRLADL